MTEALPEGLVISEPDRAVRALERFSAGVADDEGRIATAVQEQEYLVLGG
jgi:hypothetical protein